MHSQEKELRTRLLSTAIQALEIRAAARQVRGKAPETRSCAQELRDRSEELRQVRLELREHALAYASALHDDGRSTASAIEAARDVADGALRDAGAGVYVGRFEREEIGGELVLWTIDAYSAA
mgnify:CR=1 FL=1